MTIGLLDHPPSNLAPVHGSCTDDFADVREVFADNLNTTRDIGASVAVFEFVMKGSPTKGAFAMADYVVK